MKVLQRKLTNARIYNTWHDIAILSGEIHVDLFSASARQTSPPDRSNVAQTLTKRLRAVQSRSLQVGHIPFFVER